MILFILTSAVLDSRREEKCPKLNGSKHYPVLFCNKFLPYFKASICYEYIQNGW
jgi:hypothetical protein